MPKRSTSKKISPKKQQSEQAVCPQCRTGSEAYRMYFNLYKFDVDLAREIVAGDRERIELDPDDVKYAVEWSTICKQHLAHVDLQYPGIVAHYWFPEKDGTILKGTVLIDGHHRAAKSLEEGEPFFVYVLSEEESRQVTVRAPGLEIE